MSEFYEAKTCPQCGRKIYPIFRPAIFNTSNTTEVFEVVYSGCVCKVYKTYSDRKNGWTTTM